MNQLNKVDKMDNKTSKKIDRSLEESAKAIDELKARLKADESQLPKNALKMEDRLQDLQQELDSISDKMLAYKLRRIADSKMLASVAELSTEDLGAEVNPKEGKPAKSTKALKGKNIKPSVEAREENKSTSRDVKNKQDAKSKYQSSTFQCKSDLEQCLIGAADPIEKALCYALFIRCAIKG